MKKLKCDQCNVTAEGETFEGWMKALMPHYMEEHADFMKAQGDKNEAEQKQEQQKWMDENRRRFEEA